MIAFFALFLWIISLLIIYKFKGKIEEKKEYTIAFFFFLISSLLFAYSTNILSCGYHLVDDHEIFRIYSDIQEKGFFNTMYLWLRDDLTIRFRPTYWIVRVSEAALLGNNMFLWHLVQTIEIGVCTFSLYVLSRKMKCSYVLSVIFAFIVLCGEQCAIIWRLGPQEGWGLLLLAVSYICVINYHDNTNKNNFLILIVCSILLAGIKESFLVLIPSEIILLVYLEWSKDNVFSKRSLYFFGKKYFGFIISNILLLGCSLFIIILFVGTNKIGYAGMDRSYSIVDYYNAITQIISNQISLYVNILLKIMLLFLIPFIAICFFQYKIQLKKQMVKLFTAIIFLLYFLGTQFILYSKSGMFERYFIPAVFGVFFFIIVLLYNWYRGLDIPKQYETIYLFILGISLLIVFKASDIRGSASRYVIEGIQTTQLLETVYNASERKESNILVCFGYEADFSASVYLQNKYGLSNVYNVYYSDNSDGKYHKGYPSSESQNSITLNEVDIFLGKSELLNSLFFEQEINTDEIQKTEIGIYSIYKR